MGGVPFTLRDGTEKEYDVDAGHVRDYYQLISFRPDIMEVFTNRLNFDYVDHTKETIFLIFPKRESLIVGINSSGQIQSFWGQIAKLSREYQQILAPYSEPLEQRLPEDHQFIRTYYYGKFPNSKPIKTTIQQKNSFFSKIFIIKI